MSPGIVAENNIVCMRFGVFAKIFSTSGRKPRSSISSASSRTRRETCFKRSCPWRERSSNLPGVPTTISIPACSASICGSNARPPYTAKVRMPRLLANSSMSFVTCVHSSRVGTTIKTCGIPLCSKSCHSESFGAITLSITGTPKARVFPVPVLA